MARPKKAIVDYFPHSTEHGKTMFIIESRWGNDGYSFWFKLLELLGRKDGHVIDCNNPDDWEFLLAKTHLSEQTANELLGCLARLDAIDKPLWEQHRLVWSDNFIEGIKDAYKRRLDKLPHKPQIDITTGLCEQKPPEKEHNPQLAEFPPAETGKVDQSKVDQSKVNKIKDNRGQAPHFTPPTLEEVQNYCRERGNQVDPEKWYDFYSAKGWMIGKNKMKDWRAAVRTWEKDEGERAKAAPFKSTRNKRRNDPGDDYRDLYR
jgi:hypothetical protein